MLNPSVALGSRRVCVDRDTGLPKLPSLEWGFGA